MVMWAVTNGGSGGGGGGGACVVFATRARVTPTTARNTRGPRRCV